MVLLNIYEKISPVILSKKLGIGICNLDSFWINLLQEKMEKEIILNNYDIFKSYNRNLDIDHIIEPFNLTKMIHRLGWREKNKLATQIIAEHLIELKVIDFNSSLLQRKNTLLDSPTCEVDYTIKYLKFCQMIQSSKTAQSVIQNVIPHSVDQSYIISELDFMLNPYSYEGKSVKKFTDNGIESLKILGTLIDDYLEDDKNFWLFDYVLNAIFSDNEMNAYYVFKVMSLIEMLIVNPKNNGKTLGEIENKLPRFLPDTINKSDSKLFSGIMRKLRNKIAHADYKKIKELLLQYKDNFMKNFLIDESEYSVENWIYNHICFKLKDTLSEILWLMLSDYDKLKEIQSN